MKSGLEGRNNKQSLRVQAVIFRVSMKSGLEGRNNLLPIQSWATVTGSQ